MQRELALLSLKKKLKFLFYFYLSMKLKDTDTVLNCRSVAEMFPNRCLLLRKQVFQVSCPISGVLTLFSFPAELFGFCKCSQRFRLLETIKSFFAQ